MLLRCRRRRSTPSSGERQKRNQIINTRQASLPLFLPLRLSAPHSQSQASLCSALRRALLLLLPAGSALLPRTATKKTATAAFVYTCAYTHAGSRVCVSESDSAVASAVAVVVSQSCKNACSRCRCRRRRRRAVPRAQSAKY